MTTIKVELKFVVLLPWLQWCLRYRRWRRVADASENAKRVAAYRSPHIRAPELQLGRTESDSLMEHLLTDRTPVDKIEFVKEGLLSRMTRRLLFFKCCTVLKKGSRLAFARTELRRLWKTKINGISRRKFFGALHQRISRVVDSQTANTRESELRNCSFWLAAADLYVNIHVTRKAVVTATLLEALWSNSSILL